MHIHKLIDFETDNKIPSRGFKSEIIEIHCGISYRFVLGHAAWAFMKEPSNFSGGWDGGGPCGIIAAYLAKYGVSSSMGSGKMMVEFFSAEMLLRVCR